MKNNGKFRLYKLILISKLQSLILLNYQSTKKSVEKLSRKSKYGKHQHHGTEINDKLKQ